MSVLMETLKLSIAKSGDNDMLIKVIDKNNDIHELSFIYQLNNSHNI